VTPLNIGVDVDEILSDFTGAFTRRASEVLGISRDCSEWDDWDIATALRITKDQEKQVWKSVLASHTFNETLGECVRAPGLARYLGRLAERRMAKVTFITARAEHVEGIAPVQWQTAKWLRNHGFEYPTVMVSFNKGPLAAALELDVFIDDKFDNCRQVKEARPECRVFMPVYLYNQRYVGDAIRAGVETCHSPYDALNQVIHF
jgi:uncharacterized HAD superfamily protein